MSGFTSFDVFRHTSDEAEFRTTCKKCGMSIMDIEECSIECGCDWFQNQTREDREEKEVEK